MRIETNTDSLKAAVDAVHAVAGHKSGDPILNNALLRLDAGKLTVTATDLDVTRIRTLDVTGEPGAITVACDVLKKALAKFPKNAALTLETEPDPNQDDVTHVRLRAGKANLRLQTLPAADFPDVAPMPASMAEGTLTFDAPELRAILTRLNLAISNEETRYYLNGIYLNPNGDGTNLVTTDGHRLSLYRTGHASSGPSIIIPKLTAYTAHKALNKRTGPVEVRWHGTRVEIHTDGDVILSKTVDGNFPDYERVFPASSVGTLTAPAADMKNALDRVSIVSSEKSRAVKFACNGSVDLTCMSPANGDASETLDDATYAGEPAETGFNSTYVRDFLNVLTGDTVTVELEGHGGPCKILDASCPEWTGLLMPMRV